MSGIVRKNDPQLTCQLLCESAVFSGIPITERLTDLPPILPHVAQPAPLVQSPKTKKARIDRGNPRVAGLLAIYDAAAYAASADVTLRRSGLSPFVFADVGEVAARGVAFRGDPTVAVGGGVSALAGLMRVHVARGLDAGARWRFDLVFGLMR